MNGAAHTLLYCADNHAIEGNGASVGLGAQLAVDAQRRASGRGAHHLQHLTLCGTAEGETVPARTSLASGSQPAGGPRRELARVDAAAEVLAMQRGWQRYLSIDPLGNTRVCRGVDALQGGARGPERGLYEKAGRLLQRVHRRCLVEGDIVDTARRDRHRARYTRVACEVERRAALRPLPAVPVVGASDGPAVGVQDA